MEERSSSSPLRAFNVQAPPQPAAGAVQGQAQQQHAASEAAARASLSSTSSDSSSSSSSSGIGDLESGAGGAVPPGRESSPEQRGSMRDAAEEPANNSPLVLTPSRLRIDSRSLVVHTTATWLTNAVWVLLILLKLTGDIGDASWWAVWVPALLNHLIDIPLQVMLIVYAPAMIGRQIGPPPPASASVGLHAQYLHLALSRTRSHVIDALTAAMDSIALLIVKCLFCNALEKGVLNDTSMRLIFTPFWAAWVVCTILDCLKERSERVLGSTRDVLYLTLLFIALQVDDYSTFGSWRVTFIVPWIWFTCLFILAWVLLVLLLFARVWARAHELLLPISFFLLLASTIPQFISYIHLVNRLDNGESSGISFADICVPNACSWLAMWASSLFICWGLAKKERIRDALLQSGAVWTMHEQVARRMRQQDVDGLQRKVDTMSDSAVRELAVVMMAGRGKPLALTRVGNTLYRRAAVDGDGEDATAAATGAAAAATAGATTEATKAEAATTATAAAAAKRSSGAGAAAAAAGRGASSGEGGDGAAKRVVAGTRPSALLLTPRPGSSARGAPHLVEASLLDDAGGGGPGGSVLSAASPGGMTLPGTPDSDVGGGARGSGGIGSGGVRAGAASRDRGGGGDGGGSGGGEEDEARDALGALASMLAGGAARAGGVVPGGRAGRAEAAASAPPAGRAASTRPAASAVPVSPFKAVGSGDGGGPPAPPSHRTHSDLEGGGKPPRAASAAPLLSGSGSGPAHAGAVGGSANDAELAAAGPRESLLGAACSAPAAASALAATASGGASGAASAAAAQRPPSGAATRPALALPSSLWSSGSGRLHGPSPPSARGGGRPQSASARLSSPSASSAQLASLAHLMSLGAAGTINETLGLATLSRPGDGDAGAGRDGADGLPEGPAGGAGAAAVVDVDADDDLCIICYSDPPSCVFLECGHGGFCARCAHLLFVRPPNECPTCRASLSVVVELDAPMPDIGGTVGVRQ